MTDNGSAGPRASWRAHASSATGTRARQEPRGPGALSCLIAALVLSASAWAQTAPAPSSADGVWIGRADGGGAACAALDVRITVEGGLLDGIASEPGSGPAPVQG